jgi:murein DD-endopeptidase MepM/ murein hydrolase activator NlpD
MFYKFLILEILACISLVSLRVHQGLPATTLAVGETTVILKAPATAPAPAPEKNSGPSPAKTVPRLPTKSPAPVTSIRPGELVFPVADHGVANVISVFGDKRGKTRRHQGIDIKAPKGTPVLATTSGFIERIQEGGSGGKQVYLRDGKGRLFYYAHLDDWSVEEYATVEAGDQLGTVGDTGNARGTTPHLHFEILLGKKKEAVDPLKFWVNV